MYFRVKLSLKMSYSITFFCDRTAVSFHDIWDLGPRNIIFVLLFAPLPLIFSLEVAYGGLQGGCLGLHLLSI